MFCSLDRVDVVIEAEQPPVFVQTDHRSPDEMEATSSLSVVLATLRLSFAQRAARARGAGMVRYAALQGASPSIQEVVAAAGAQLESLEGGAPAIIPFDGVPRHADVLLDEAFARLATEVAQREEIDFHLEDLAAFEGRLHARKPTQDDDEVAWWTSVVELAAVAGECARAARGAKWLIVPTEPGELEYLGAHFEAMFEIAEDDYMDLANRAHWSLSRSSASPSPILAAFEEPEEEDFTPAIMLTPAKPQSGDLARRALLSTLDGSPVMVVGEHFEEKHAFIPDCRPSEKEAKKRFEEALAFIERAPVTTQRWPEGNGLYVTGAFAAEKIAAREFMRGLHEELSNDTLTVAIPCSGLLMAVGGVPDPASAQSLIDSVEQQFALAAEQGFALTTHLFRVVDGEIVA